MYAADLKEVRQSIVEMSSLAQHESWDALVRKAQENLDPSDAADIMHAFLEDGSEFEGLRILHETLLTARQSILLLADTTPTDDEVMKALAVFGGEVVRAKMLSVLSSGDLIRGAVEIAARALADFGDKRLVPFLAVHFESRYDPDIRQKAASLWWKLSAVAHFTEHERSILETCITGEQNEEIRSSLHDVRHLQGNMPRLLETHARGLDELAENAFSRPGEALYRAVVQSFGRNVSKEMQLALLLTEDTPPLLRLLASFGFHPEEPEELSIPLHEKQRALQLLEQAAEHGDQATRQALETRVKQWTILLADFIGTGYYDVAPKGEKWWKAWQLACENAAEALHGTLLRASRDETELSNGRRPDVVVSGAGLKRDESGRITYSDLIVDAKVGRYYDEPLWLEYEAYCAKLEIWWLGIGRPDNPGEGEAAHFMTALSSAIADLLATDGKSKVESWNALIDPDDVSLTHQFLAMCNISPDELPIHPEWARRGFSDPVEQRVIDSTHMTDLRDLYAKLKGWAKDYRVRREAGLFIVDSHRPKKPYRVDLERGTCECKYYRNDTGVVRRRCVHMFAAERLAGDEAIPLRMRALHSQLDALRSQLSKRAIRSGQDVVSELRRKGHIRSADSLQNVIDEVQAAEDAHSKMYQDRVSILTAFNNF
jgi:hypothetical protein